MGHRKGGGGPTAAPEVLRSYFDAHPKAKKFQEKPIPNVDKTSFNPSLMELSLPVIMRP